MSEPYTNVERAVLQYIIALGSVKHEDLVIVQDKLRHHFDTEDEELKERIETRDVEDSVELINNKLRPLGYEILVGKTQDTLEMVYTYANMVKDAPSRNFTTKSAGEIAVIRKIVESIFADQDGEEEFVVSSTEALKICQKETGKSASQSQNFLRQLVNEGWLEYSKSGKFAASTRTLTELRKTLLDQYGAKTLENPEGLINICKGCNDITTKGLRCPNKDCVIRFHKNCHISYKRAYGSTCPNTSCGVDWEEQMPLPVGELGMRNV